MRSVTSLPSARPQIAILSCFKANLRLSLQSSKVSGYFGSESHPHALSRSEPTSTFLEAWSYKATLWEGTPAWKRGGGTSDSGVLLIVFRDSPSARPHRGLREPMNLQSGARSSKKTKKKTEDLSHAVGVKDGVRCPFRPRRLGHHHHHHRRRLLTVPSSLSQF